MCEMPLDPPEVNDWPSAAAIHRANQLARAQHPEGKLLCLLCNGWFYRLWQHQTRQHFDDQALARAAHGGDADARP